MWWYRVVPPVNVIVAEQRDLFTAQRAIIRKQDGQLVPQREGREDIVQHRGPLVIVWSPGDCLASGDHTRLFAPLPTTDGVDLVMALSGADTPGVEETHRVEASPDRGRREVRARQVDGGAPVPLVP